MSQTDDRWIAGLAIILVLALALTGRLTQRPRPSEPARRDPATATTWMADCLPGVGLKRRDAAALALREGRIDQLPAQARPAVSRLFVSPDQPR